MLYDNLTLPSNCVDIVHAIDIVNIPVIYHSTGWVMSDDT